MPEPGRRGLRGGARRGQGGAVKSRRPARSLILSAAVPTVAVLVVIVFAGFALLGSNGWLALEGYQKQRAAREAQLARYQEQQARLENRKRLIARGDPDYADELVRRNTDMIERNEYMVVDH